MERISTALHFWTWIAGMQSALLAFRRPHHISTPNKGNSMFRIARPALLAIFILGLPAKAAEKPTTTVVYLGATLIDTSTGTTKPNVAIFTQGDRIVEIRSAEEAVQRHGRELVDIHGKFVIPGLVNSHVHTATVAVPRLAKAYLRRELYSGVTTVRDMAGDVRLLSELKREAEFGEIPSPDIFYVALIAGPGFFVDPRTHDAARGRVAGQVPWMQAITTETNLPLAMAEAAGTGATAVKIYGDLSGSLVKNITAEAHRQHLLVWSHAAVFPALPADIADAGVDVMSHACLLGYQLSDPPLLTNEDPTPVDAAKFLKPNPMMSALYRTLKQRGIILDATLFPYEFNQSHSCTGVLSNYLAREAYQAGVMLSAGTDDDPIWDDSNSAIDAELTLLVDKVGMTTADALRSATVIGARAAGQENDAGSIDVGKLANMVVLNKNPLENIANIRSVYMVIKRGVRYPRSAYNPVTLKEMKQYAQ
jgi:imidazolonepropionase-like amidohydrolase